ncbi:MAG: YihY family inner membrane protein [Phycisphaeraceae bacterium]|nr:MAG: YihY family inner membrane protein [Phycisphaeraceae bacterium]
MKKIRESLDRLAGEGTAPDDLTRVQRMWRGGVDLAKYSARMLARESAPQMAAALTYRTIFSLIPVFVLSLIFMRALLGDQGIRDQLDRLMEWLAFDEIVVVQGEALGEEGDEDSEALGAFVGVTENDDGTVTLAEYLGEFVDNAVRRMSEINFGAITAVGALVFIYAALSLLIQIEGAFNRICRAPSGRRFVSRVTNYWTLLTLGSLLIFFSIALGSNYGAVSQLPSWLSWASDPLRLLTRVGATWLVLIFAYVCMPNTRVRLRCAAVGAAVAAILWEIGKTGLTWFVTNATGGQIAVYGSLAVVPLFLFWVYVTWLIVLFGLQIAYVLQTVNRASASRERGMADLPLVDPAIGVIVVRAIAERFERGELTTVEALAAETGLADSLLGSMLRAAEEAGIVRHVDGDRDDDGYALARPARAIPVVSILRAMETLAPRPVADDAAEALDGFRGQQCSSLERKTLADLYESKSAADDEERAALDRAGGALA